MTTVSQHFMKLGRCVALENVNRHTNTEPQDSCFISIDNTRDVGYFTPSHHRVNMSRHKHTTTFTLTVKRKKTSHGSSLIIQLVEGLLDIIALPWHKIILCTPFYTDVTLFCGEGVMTHNILVHVPYSGNQWAMCMQIVRRAHATLILCSRELVV